MNAGTNGKGRKPAQYCDELKRVHTTDRLAQVVWEFGHGKACESRTKAVVFGNDLETAIVTSEIGSSRVQDDDEGGCAIWPVVIPNHRGISCIQGEGTISSASLSFYRESTPDERNTIVEILEAGIKPVLPAPYSVSNRVYEYGASQYDVLPDDRLIFSHSDDTVRLVNPDTGDVTLLVQNPVLRYASFSASPSLPWVLAIEEDHTNDTPYEIENYVVAINVETGEVRRVVSGSDFYYMPRFSRDGQQVVWMEWDHPDMCFDAARLYVGGWADGSVENPRLIAGSGYDGVAEPRWGLDGSLFFAKEAGPYRQLFRLRPGTEEPELIEPKGLEKAEFGEMGLFEGSCTYVPLSKEALVASAVLCGIRQLVVIDLETTKWHAIANQENLCQINYDAMARLDSTSFLVIGSGTASPLSIRKIDVAHPQLNRVIRNASDESFPLALYSKPEAISIQSKGSPSRIIHGFLWMPHNPNFTGPNGERPPLIIVAHGGPTGHMSCGVNLRTQYWTSRGYALLGLNYTGSTGYGRDYRNALFHGGWGILDADDAAEFAQYLSSTGRVKSSGISITGISAGGYNVLQVLSRHSSLFAAGLCISGISDILRFDGRTHKLESDYTAKLLLPPGGVDQDTKERLYRERSALYHVTDITSPLVLLHGKEDSVVPYEQATLVAEELQRRGRNVGITVVEGEGHMMAQPASTRLWLEEEEKLWRRTLL
ncbi:hypothetical protein BBP40_003379 [Aspergillus hancockii]|nr:hypothetical protein BBP40_003379 [Aspergillus hancockii]